MNLNKLILVFLFSSFIVGASLHSKNHSLNNITKENEKLYKRARGLEKSGFQDEAEQIYDQIFIDSPKNEKYYNALKKILIKKEDCVSLMDKVNIFCEASLNSDYSKINKLEILLICNADWENLFYELSDSNQTDLKFLKRLFSLLIKQKQEFIVMEAVDKARTINKNKAFFSNELAYYYMSLKRYPESLEEFLNYLEQNPKNLQIVKNRVMSFPNELNLNKKITAILSESKVAESKVILADFYFKIEDFNEAIKILKEYNLMDDLLNVSINLNKLGEFKIANDLLLYIIENANNKLTQKAIFELANTLEKRSLKKKSDLIVSSFMNQNAFFSSPFLRINEADSDLMHKAIEIYDSLSVKNNLTADFKLSEIQFKALGDLDGAYQSYNKVYKFTKNKELKLKSILSIADILIAKGQLDKALEKIDVELETKIWNNNDQIQLKLKQNQILFYQSELDFVFEDLSIIADEYPVSEYDFNNIIDIITILILFKDQTEKFEKFSAAQLKIHQNKRTEAIKILASISKNDGATLLNNLISYQMANLLIYQNKVPESIEVLNLVSGEDIYNELSQILLAEIHDYLLEDLASAKFYYLSILQNFPNSIHYEQVRIRLKQIMDESL
jgi:tetratricopeptide (TPR) repeat protein/predicted negative regulator of RcsB-dependent stress response